MIEPKILKGTRDFLPEEKAKRDYVMNKIRNVFELYGYDSIETPVIEHADVILGKYGEEGDKLTYNFEDNGGRQIALRYDQTVPFARLYAKHWGELPSPFKRYQISRVWRADKPQKGRYREFYQCDIDIIGTDSIMCETEIALVIRDVFKELGLGSIKIKFNDRSFVDSILDAAGVPVDERMKVISTIDKVDKIGKEAVMEMLGDKSSTIELLLDGDNSLGKFSDYKTENIEKFLELMEEVGMTEMIEFDPALARGLDYYTGIIFEVVCEDLNLGSIAGGGRYDNLCGSFSKQEFTGTGIAFGFDRIMDTMEDLGLLNDIKLSSEVLVAQFEDGEKHTLDIYNKLHEMGVNAEMYFEPAKLGKQFKYADRKRIPFVAIAGPEEVEKGVVMLKNMRSGEQKEVQVDAIADELMN